jgi:hypothetical protein
MDLHAPFQKVGKLGEDLTHLAAKFAGPHDADVVRGEHAGLPLHRFGKRGTVLNVGEQRLDEGSHRRRGRLIA